MSYASDRDYECISALQKFVRRGMEKECGRVFFELELRGQFAWAMSRLQIIAHEDCGVGDMTAVLFALRSIDDAKELYKKKNNGWVLPAANAILALCRCKKTRVSDHFQAACRHWNNSTQIEIPDYCYDKHTKKGKRLGRGVDHFVDEASLLTNGIEDEYKEVAREFWHQEINNRKDLFGE